MNVRGRPSLPEWCTFNPLGRQFLPALLYETLTMRFFLIDRITNWEVPRAAEAIKNVAQLPRLLLDAAFVEKSQRSAKAILTVIARTFFPPKPQPIPPGRPFTPAATTWPATR